MQFSDLDQSTMNNTTQDIGILPLKGVIQHYDWGGKSFLPNLIGEENPTGKPFAELWMGAHNRGPATLELQGKTLELPGLIENYPDTVLGNKVLEQFGAKLPFLFKILDVDRMLSIQAHPTKTRAEEGYALENDNNVPLTAYHRNYKDDNHKPEIMYALTEFWLLHGFKSSKQIFATLQSIPELSELLSHFEDQDIFQLYKTIMEWPQEKVNKILQPLSIRLLPALEAGQLTPNQADYWAALGFRDMVKSEDQMDRGIFSIYLFNLVHLQPGQAIFQDAGIPHAYLKGVNVELMANSDNVFRGGLTSKHIDVKELLENLVFDPIIPNIIEGTAISETETVYSTPAPDFELRKIEIQAGQTHHNASTNAPAILILMEGTASINEQLPLNQGEIVLIPANIFCNIEAKEDGALLFKALVP